MSEDNEAEEDDDDDDDNDEAETKGGGIKSFLPLISRIIGPPL